MTLSDLRKTKDYKDLQISDQREFERMLKLIKKDCKPFLRELKRAGGNKEPLLYRNMHNAGTMGQKDVRKDREPRDTRREVHKVFDETLEEFFDIRYRSQSLFVSGDDNWGSSYGHPYVIFPIGKFSFIWSPAVRDSYSKVSESALVRYARDEYPHYFKEEYEKLFGEGKRGRWVYSFHSVRGDYASTKKEAVKKIIELYGDDDIRDRNPHLKEGDNLEKMLMKTVEWEPDEEMNEYISLIMRKFVEDSAQLTSEEYEMARSVLEKSIIDRLKYTDKNLIAAIESRHEIMLYCDSYYYLDEYNFSRLLRDYFYNR